MPTATPSDDTPVPPNRLPAPSRVITTHSDLGKSVFDKTLPREVPVQVLDPRAYAALTYVTTIPATLTGDDVDLRTYTNLLQDPPGLTIPNAAVLRTYDMAPGVASPLHRTTSIDFLVVLNGEMELTLDSGEVQKIWAGEVVIQRGTMHSWKNVSDDWSRMLAVTIPVNKLVVGGEARGEDLGGIRGLKDSER